VVVLAAPACALRGLTGSAPGAAEVRLTCRDGDAPVRWIETPDSLDRRRLVQWCASVGPPVVADFTDGRREPVDSLAVVSWNTHVGGGDVIGLVTDLRAGALTGGVPVRDFVLALQEVPRAGSSVPTDVPDDLCPDRIEAAPPGRARADIVEIARELRLWLFYAPSMRNGPPGSGATEEDRGNALLCTRALGDLVAMELPLEAMRRVPVGATFSARTDAGRDWSANVWSVHLDNKASFARNFGSGGIVGRMQQARALADSVTGASVVLAGDFNTWALGPIERAVEIVEEQFPNAICTDDGPTMIFTALPDRRVDYMFARLAPGARLRYGRLLDAFGSDHRPLLGWLVPAPITSATPSGAKR
jgi:endonuclease/exonuclease/phosphatase family metal-dependent hydrolase